MKIRNLICASALALSIPTVALAESTKLLANSFLSPQHPVTKMVFKPWVEKIAEVTEGRVVVDLAPATLAAPHQQISSAKNGVFDVSYQFHGLMAKQVKLNQIAHLPFVNTTSRGSSVALWRTYEKFFAQAGELDDVQVLGMFALPAGVMFGMGSPINSVADLNGNKVYGLPGVPAQIVEAAGAGVVAAPAARSYEIISGKTVDAFVGYSVSDAAGLKTLPYATDVTDVPGALSMPSFVLFMNKDRWNKLSAADKAAIESISGEAFAQSMSVYDALEEKVRAGSKEKGLNFHVASDAFVGELEKLAAPLYEGWKADASAAGLNADEVIAFYKATAASNK